MKNLRQSKCSAAGRQAANAPSFVIVFALPRLVTVLGCVFLFAVAPIALHAQTYTDLYDVTCTNGCLSYPPGILAQGRDGNLYGTMFAGGTGDGGTVFKITPSGAITVIYNFAGADGYGPSSGLTLGTDGNFYGTTRSGGANSLGTIFQITPAGVLTTLHSFTGSDGQTPYAPPVEGKNGSYYGVALGPIGLGTGYSVTSSGTFKLLSTAIPQDSISPLLLASDGNFYGTTAGGGTIGQGTVFRMSATGAVKIVYNFDGTHGRVPYGPVVQGSDRFLYGTTPAGGSSTTGGVIFKLSTSGKITVLHEFDQNSMTDGYGPEDGLVLASDGNFYGATSAGLVSAPAQYGTLFKIAKSGTYSIQYVFDATHGAYQYANSMQHTNGTLYGLPNAGGSGGNGVFYSLAEGIPPFVSLVGYPGGAAGTTVEILGDGLTGASNVMFGSGSANFSVVSDTYMTAVVPASGTTGAVTVTTPSGALKSKQIFKLLPVILSLKPTSGPVGTQVTIVGTGLTGATTVTFGGVKATVFTVNSGTQVTATVPAGALTGKIKITTAGGTATSSGTFTVT
jgi:uncharacterized repeat protein (TIGR03803 family)